ncbi:MAG: hypothetical protein M0D55_11890 [Elusimicrobiota bacterium]|nr:MAG: hypothetical protein M0D55_11890 [Elusimicrobiota bacterium]
MTGALLAVALAAPARAASPFVEQLRKAESRDERDQERIEFATRALRAWVPADGRPLLAHAHFARAVGSRPCSTTAPPTRTSRRRSRSTRATTARA